jgi:hypothetical protein
VSARSSPVKKDMSTSLCGSCDPRGQIAGVSRRTVAEQDLAALSVAPRLCPAHLVLAICEDVSERMQDRLSFPWEATDGGAVAAVVLAVFVVAVEGRRLL